MMLHDFLLHAEKTGGDRTAVRDSEIVRSYRETADRVRRAATGLAAAGLSEDDRVAILAPNNADFFEAYYACSLAGLIAVPVNIRLSPAEIAYVLDDCGASMVLTAPEFDALVPADSRRIVFSDEGDASWAAMIAAQAPMQEPVGTQDENRTAHIFYTGGTTGRAKGVMLSHRNVAASATNKIVLGQFARDDVWLHAAPMFHQADSWACFSLTALAAEHVFLPKFDPDLALDLIERHGVTAFQLVPTMLLMMLDAHDRTPRRLDSLRRVLYGSAPMPSDTLQRCKTVYGDVFQHIYGLTEAAGTVAATPWPPEAGETTGERMTSCGHPIVGVEMRIADTDGSAVEAGTVGHIQVMGANVMRGYWENEAETAKAFVDGWLDTGDAGYVDADGFVFIVDRTKDMIITGGENVYSSEVENVLFDHPAIAEAAVIGLADPKWGEAVTAVVVPTKADLTETSVIAHCRERLAGYKCPKSVIFRDALPKSSAGKVLKHELRAAYE